MRSSFRAAAFVTLSVCATLAIGAQPASADHWQDTGYVYDNLSECHAVGSNGEDQGLWFGYQCRGSAPNIHLWVNVGQ